MAKGKKRSRRRGPDFAKECKEIGISTRDMASGGHSYRLNTQTIYGKVTERVSKSGREALVNSYYNAKKNLRSGGDISVALQEVEGHANVLPADFVRSSLETCITGMMKGRSQEDAAVVTLGRWKEHLSDPENRTVGYVSETARGFIKRAARRNASSPDVTGNLETWKPYLPQGFIDDIAEKHYDACLRASEREMAARRPKDAKVAEARQNGQEIALNAVESALADVRKLGVAKVNDMERKYMDHCIDNFRYTRMLEAAERVGMSEKETLGYKMEASERAIEHAIKKRLTEDVAVGYVRDLNLSKLMQEMVMHELLVEVARAR